MMICDLKVGYSCNNECVHCVISDNRAALKEHCIPYDLTTDECKKVLDSYKIANVDCIVLTGGEVTIRSDFLELVNYCNKLGFFINVQSNGRKFTDMSICSSLSGVQNIIFLIAIHGPNKEVHDKITNRPGSFDETLNGLRNLRKLDKKVVVKVVMTKYNLPYLIEILELLYSIDIMHVNFAFPHGYGNARKNFDSITPKYSELKDTLERLIEESLNRGMCIEFEAVPFCIIPDYPENVSEIHHLLDQKNYFVKPVWDSTLNWNEIRPTIRGKGCCCEECCYDMICEGPWIEYLEHFGDEELKPVCFVPDTFIKLLTKITRIQNY